MSGGFALPTIIREFNDVDDAGSTPVPCNDVPSQPQLVKQSAAYNLTLPSGPFDWYLRLRFDTAWYSPLPSLSTFSPLHVSLPYNQIPVGDQFALVPGALAPAFFSAYRAVESCDLDASWIPCSDCTASSVLWFNLLKTNTPFTPTDFPFLIVRSNEGGAVTFLRPLQLPCLILEKAGVARCTQIVMDRDFELCTKSFCNAFEDDEQRCEGGEDDKKQCKGSDAQIFPLSCNDYYILDRDSSYTVLSDDPVRASTHICQRLVHVCVLRARS